MLFREQPLGVPREFEKGHAFFQIGFVGVLVPVDLALATILLLAPLVGHFLEEGRIHQSVELVNIHGVDAIIEPLVFGLMALDRVLVFAPLVCMAGMKRIAHPFQHLVIESQLTKQFGELRFQRFLAHIYAAARSGVSQAPIGVAGAMIIDIALLLDLSDHGAAALPAGDEARESEVVSAALSLLREAAVEHALHPLPKLDGHKRLMPALDELAVPLEPAGIEPVAQDRGDAAARNVRAALSEGNARRPGLLRDLLQGNVAACVPFEQFLDQGRCGLVGLDDLLAVRLRHVAIAERCD